MRVALSERGFAITIVSKVNNKRVKMIINENEPEINIKMIESLTTRDVADVVEQLGDRQLVEDDAGAQILVVGRGGRPPDGAQRQQRQSQHVLRRSERERERVPEVPDGAARGSEGLRLLRLLIKAGSGGMGPCGGLCRETLSGTPVPPSA